MLPEHQDIIDDRKDAGQHDEQQVSGQWRAKDRDLSADRPEPRQQADGEHGQCGHSAHIMEHLLLQPAFTLIAFAMIMLGAAHQFIFFHPYSLLHDPSAQADDPDEQRDAIEQRQTQAQLPVKQHGLRSMIQQHIQA